MSGITETFSNPWVLGGGALLGLVLLMGKNHASTADSTATNPAYSSAVMAFNTAALGQVTQQAQIAANVQMNRNNNDTTQKIGILATLRSAMENTAVVQQQMIKSQEGITTAQITTQGAVTMDIMNNGARLALAQEQTLQSIHHDNSSVQIAQMQAKAARNASNNNLIGNIIKTVASVALAPVTGGASLLGLGSLSTGPSTGQLIDAGFTNTGPQVGDPIY